MASSTSHLDLIIQSQASKEVTANNAFNALSPAAIFGRRESLCTGLNWFWYGGAMLVDGVLTTIANNGAALVLTANQTNYIEATRAGVVSRNTTAFTPGLIPLYTVVAGATTVTSYTDNRAWVEPRHVTSQVSVAMGDANVTLSAAQARCRYLTLTGALTAARDVVVPNEWEGLVFCSTTGFGVVVKTSAGTSVTVAPTMRAHLFADGTNVVRITADV